jgi:hypothetical protein
VATRTWRTELAKLPRELQAQITQQSESLFQVRIVPLREQWKQLLATKQRADQDRDAQRRKELTADAEAAGRMQAARAIAREKAQRGDVSPGELARIEQTTDRDVLALQSKYNSYGVSSRTNWGQAFAGAVSAAAARAAVELRLADRLQDTTTELGRDAHQATELMLSVQRSQFLQAQRVITPQEAQSQSATAEAALAPLRAKYSAGSGAADFNERVRYLVQNGAAEQRPAWEREVASLREAAAARAVAERSAAEAARAAPAIPASAPPATRAAPAPAPRTTTRQAGGGGAAPPPALPRPRPVDGPTLMQRAGGWAASLTPILLLLVAGGAGYGVYAYRSRRALAPPSYSNIGEQYTVPPVSSPPAAMARVAAPTPTPEVSGATLKERMSPSSAPSTRRAIPTRSTR